MNTGDILTGLRIPHNDVIVTAGPVVVLRLRLEGGSPDLLGRVDTTEKFIQGKFDCRTQDAEGVRTGRVGYVFAVVHRGGQRRRH